MPIPEVHGVLLDSSALRDGFIDFSQKYQISHITISPCSLMLYLPEIPFHFAITTVFDIKQKFHVFRMNSINHIFCLDCLNWIFSQKASKTDLITERWSFMADFFLVSFWVSSVSVVEHVNPFEGISSFKFGRLMANTAKKQISNYRTFANTVCQVF